MVNPSFGNLLEFLDRSGQLLAPDNTPWPTLDESVEVLEIDWQRLFGQGRNVEWEPDFPEAVIVAAEEALRGQRPRDLPTGEQAGRRADVCAWYQPIHFHGSAWGIFIGDECLTQTALDILAFAPRSSWVSPLSRLRQAWRLAFAHLYLHESFHHGTESFAIRLHVARQIPAYRTYWHDVYLPDSRNGTTGALEEALANAVGYTRLASKPFGYGVDSDMRRAARDYLQWLFPALPPGYRDAPSYLQDVDFAAGKRRLAAQVDEGVSWPSVQRENDLSIATQLSRGLFDLRTASWAVVKRGSRPVLPVFPRLKTVSSKMLEARLRKEYGYERVKGAGKGSHVKLTAPGKAMIIIPGDRRELSPPVLKSTALSLGMGSARELCMWLEGS